jgi:iron complex transport system substrate-binding protein
MEVYMKKTIKQVITWILLTLMVVAGGCSPEVSPRHLSPEGDNITISDCTGRQVTIPSNPQRIACLCPEAAHILVMLGCGDRIVAVPNGVKRDVLLNEICPAVQKAAVPRTSGSINIEELNRVQADLVLLRSEAIQSSGEAHKLEVSQIPYLLIEYDNMEEQQDMIAMIAEAVGAKAKAQSYNQYYRQCVERVQKQVGRIPAEARLRVYHSINEATRTDTRGTLGDQWLSACGAINVSVNEKLKMVEGEHYASLEQILLWNPDVILANDANVISYIQSHPQWAALEAVKNGQVYALPNGISRWGHPSSMEIPLALLWTSKLLYPSFFEDIDILEEMRWFYEEFFSLQLSDDKLAQIISGKGMRDPKS